MYPSKGYIDHGILIRSCLVRVSPNHSRLEIARAFSIAAKFVRNGVVCKRDVGKITIWRAETAVDRVPVDEIKREEKCGPRMRRGEEKSSLKGNSNFLLASDIEFEMYGTRDVRYLLRYPFVIRRCFSSRGQASLGCWSDLHNPLCPFIIPRNEKAEYAIKSGTSGSRDRNDVPIGFLGKKNGKKRKTSRKRGGDDGLVVLFSVFSRLSFSLRSTIFPSLPPSLSTSHSWRNPVQMKLPPHFSTDASTEIIGLVTLPLSSLSSVDGVGHARGSGTRANEIDTRARAYDTRKPTNSRKQVKA